MKRSVSAAIAKGKAKWTAVANCRELYVWSKGVITFGSLAATFGYYVKEDYEKIILPLRELEEKLIPSNHIIEKLCSQQLPPFPFWSL
ncbi:hypothetical protein EON65_54450 [archaeon]|nr:MAG: hypothetical protein EON65_54450 [archaeon]